jgi:hypothetical protein
MSTILLVSGGHADLHARGDRSGVRRLSERLGPTHGGRPMDPKHLVRKTGAARDATC